MPAVLFIEDEIGEISWAIDLVESRGYDTEFVSNEQDANLLIEAIKQKKKSYALAIVDVTIPILPFEHIVEVDDDFLHLSANAGVRLCKKIRGSGISKSALPVVCITGRSDEQEIQAEMKQLDITVFSRAPRHGEDSLRNYISKNLPRLEGKHNSAY